MKRCTNTYSRGRCIYARHNIPNHVFARYLRLFYRSNYIYEYNYRNLGYVWRHIEQVKNIWFNSLGSTRNGWLCSFPYNLSQIVGITHRVHRNFAIKD